MMKLRISKMFNRTFSDFKEWLDEEEVEYFTTPDNDIILNFKDMRIDQIYDDEVCIYLNKNNRYKVFEITIGYDCTDVKIFWA